MDITKKTTSNILEEEKREEQERKQLKYLIKSLVDKAIIWGNVPDTHSDFQEEQINVVSEELEYLLINKQIELLKFICNEYGEYNEKIRKHIVPYNEILCLRINLEEYINEKKVE